MKFRKYGWTFGVLGCLAFAWGILPAQVDARLKYKQTFEKKYPALAGEVKKVKCGVCHPPNAAEKKKVRNNYGQSLENALNAKNVRDEEVILKALTTIESEKSASEGKTFGDLIKAGTLPGKNE